MGCHCAEGWICKAHPDLPAHHDGCAGRSSRCLNDACPWWRGPLPPPVNTSTWGNVIGRDATPEATILDPRSADGPEPGTSASAGLPSSTLTRDCPDCRVKGGMVRQNSGLFTVYYLCSKCGTQFTIPPPEPPRGI